MQLIYNTKVTGIGAMASTFLADKMLILFKDNAPDELADYCILHSGNQLSDAIQKDDVLVIAGEEYQVTYVGDEVQTNLHNLGHITLRFDGGNDGLGGSLYLEDKAVPDINIGDVISIYKK